MGPKITGERSTKTAPDAAPAAVDDRVERAAITSDAPEAPAIANHSGEGQVAADRWTGIASGDSGHRGDLGSGSQGVSQAVQQQSMNLGSGLLALHQAANELAASRA